MEPPIAVGLHDVAVIIPALDEEASLPGVLAALPPGPRVVVVDNGSTDRTAEVARAGGAVVVVEPTRGYGGAVQAGIAWLAADPPAVVVVLDADHADDPGRLPELVGPIVAGVADLVLADRTALAEPGALTPAQRWGNRLALAGIHRATGHRYRDLGPFRALRWTSLRALDLQDRTWGWNVEMQIKAVRAGLRIVEIPLPYRRRRAGVSKISGTVLGVARAGYRIVVTLARHGAS
ncbi:MAG: glycosyltransferase [Alphaproteobacteria bacterium]|nr:glycosyltransferase [Alphaproteobacteria bacterium]